MAITEREPVPMPNPRDLRAVVEYAADVYDSGGNNRALRAVLRRFLDIPVVDEQGRFEAVDAQVAIGQTLTMNPRAWRGPPPR